MTDAVSSLTPSPNDFWFLPLGGTGEIGMNLNLYGHSDCWIMVDCGATFNTPLDPSLDKRFDIKREDVVIPDASFIIERSDKLAAIVITHAHEDHIGALIQIWPKLQVPIYTTAFTAEVIRRKFYREELFYDLPIVVVNPGDSLDLGPFTVKWLSITHSIPETQALLITTPVGKVFHTADWKIDTSPVVGHKFKQGRFKSLQSERILAMVCDSTNALRPGCTPSEYDCQIGLKNHIEAETGRVIVTCFASNLARVISVAKIAKETGRYLALFGRALENMVSIARLCDYWPDDLDIIPSRHIGYLPPEEVLILATGSQGEPRAALNQMALGRHRHCDLGKNDTVIFSSFVIPGNEAYVEKVVQLLRERDVKVITKSNSSYTIHVSGHPSAEDLGLMYRWVKPHCAVPTHGEAVHMQANADIALQEGVPQSLVGLNGDLFQLAPTIKIFPNAVPAQRIAVKQ